MRYTALALAILAAISVAAETKVTQQNYGKTKDGTAVDIYTLTDGKITARIMNLGGIVVSLSVPDRNGKAADVALGFDDIAGYLTPNPFFGALIGRYGNRIGKGHLEIDGKTYQLAKNNGPNTLHGGVVGWDKKVWDAKTSNGGLDLTYVSKDGEESFPGTVTAHVRYTIEDGGLKIEYNATTDKTTVLNLTNHSYFNLAGAGNGDVLKHEIQINASKFTPTDDGLIPTGEIKAVAGTPFDFLKSTAIGARIDNKDDQLKYGLGYDHNWVLDGTGLKKAATVYEPTSGRVMEVWTMEPGVQFYTGNHLDGTVKGKGGVVYKPRMALCLETQHFPDSPNHANFPTTLLKPGQKYHTVTIYKFSTR